jgi:hypothetical protein
MTLTFPSPGFDDAVAAVCHGTASDAQLEGLHGLLRAHPAARDEYILRVELHARLASEPELFAPVTGDFPMPTTGETRGELPLQFRTASAAGARRSWRRNQVLALAACLALLLAGGWWLRYGTGNRRGATSRAVAMLNREVNARWNPADHVPCLGAPLEPGRLRLESGLAQIVFYNGARVVIEGPAELRLVSSTEAVCTGGKLTAEVPPQARGFRVLSPRFDVTDLGTSFGLNMTGERSELHVFEGRVEFRSGQGATNQSLHEGHGAVAQGGSAPELVTADPTAFASLFELQARSVAADALRYDRWRAANQRLRHDPSLWVHFDFEHGSPSDWRLPNTGARSATVPDATIVGGQWQEGRWASKPALEFRGVSDRVRLSVPGTCESVTLAAWVRVQGLDRPINSLFMSDGFEAGTVHWVVRGDGVLGLTVIGARGAHQILTSPPVLSVDQFGIWTHLAVVLNGPAKQAVHYVNGQRVSQHPVRIGPPYHIGAAELGNWNAIGFPGNDPFLIRNFSGVMDEFCLFGRALSDAEIRALYADGKPQADTLAAAERN